MKKEFVPSESKTGWFDYMLAREELAEKVIIFCKNDTNLCYALEW